MSPPPEGADAQYSDASATYGGGALVYLSLDQGIAAAKAMPAGD